MVLWCLSNLVFRDALAFVVRCNLCSSWPGLVLALVAELFFCFFHHLFLCFISDGRALAFAVRDFWVHSMLSWKKNLTRWKLRLQHVVFCSFAFIWFDIFCVYCTCRPVWHTRLRCFLCGDRWESDVRGHRWEVTGESQRWDVRGEWWKVRCEGFVFL